MQKKQYIAFGISIFLWVAVYLVLYLIAPAVPTFDTRMMLVKGRYLLPLLSGLLLLFTTLFILSTAPRIEIKPWKIFLFLFIAVVIDNYAKAFDRLGYIWSFLISDLAIIFIAVLLGKLLASSVQQRSWIIPIALVAMVADIWSVSYGPTDYLISLPPEVMRHFLLFYPLLGASTLEATTVPYWMRPFIGMSDVIFLCLYLELARKFELHTTLSRIAMGAAMLIPIALASFAEKGIPALPFMSAIFIFVNFRYLDFNKKELVQCVVFIAVLACILFILYQNPATREFMSLER